MILPELKQKFEMTGVDSPKGFNVKVGGKLFKTLFGNLYSDPIRAVIRELSTNAWEIHKQLGKENVPFLVKLPSWLDANFIIRDYGSGLSEEQVDGLYTTAFDSTKDNSNDLGGAFGLGSKCPFAYTNNFIVTSYYNGFKYTYFFVMDEEGLPSQSLASKVITQEPNGLEITIAVKKEDIRTFAQTASDVYRWFANKPKVVGNSDYVQHKETKPLIEGEGWSYHQDSTYGTNHRAIAVTANVAYDLSAFPGNRKFLIEGMVLYFNIGEVSPNPSRESLAFDKATIKSVEEKLKTVELAIQKEAEAKIAKCKNVWEACQEATKLDSIFNISQIIYNGQDVKKAIEFPKNELITTITNRRDHFGAASYADVRRHLPKCIVDDLPKGGISRAKNFIKHQIPSYAFFCKYGEDVSRFKKLLMIDDDQIILTSSLSKVERAASTGSRHSHKTKVMQLTGDNHSATYCWTDTEVDLKNDTGYYVEITNNRFKFGTKELHPQDLYKISKELGITIYGIKSAAIKKIGSGWTCPFDYIKKELLNRIDSNKSVLDDKETYFTVINELSYFMHNMGVLSKKFVNQVNEITIFYKEICDLRSKIIKDDDLREKLLKFKGFLLDIHGTTSYDSVANKNVKTVFDALKKKFPLIFCSMNSDYVKELHYYVTQILEKGR